MRIGIDATNIGGGGGLTHLLEILNELEVEKHKITKIYVYASSKILNQLPNKYFIEKSFNPLLDGNLIKRLIFQLFIFDKIIKVNCDILFSITGDYMGSFRPLVGMSRNMLLYERDIWKEIKQPKEVIRFYLNFLKQKRCFKNSQSIIFISNYAKNYASKSLNISSKDKVVIHHGISARFSGNQTPQKHISQYSINTPFNFLYVSTIHIYKNHVQVVKAISSLRKAGYPVVLTLVGGSIFKPAEKALQKIITIEDPKGEFIKMKGHVEYGNIQNEYLYADGIIYASTCENMPNTLIESMASGKAIACSDKQPMPEFLNESGFYFDAKNYISIRDTLIKYLENPSLREVYIVNNKKDVDNYSWNRTSYETFSFLLKTYKNYINN